MCERRHVEGDPEHQESASKDSSYIVFVDKEAKTQQVETGKVTVIIGVGGCKSWSQWSYNKQSYPQKRQCKNTCSNQGKWS